MELAVQIAALLGVVITIIVQTATFIWFFSKLDSRVSALEEGQMDTKDHPNRLTKMEVLLEIIQKQQDEHTLKLDNIAHQIARTFK